MTSQFKIEIGILQAGVTTWPEEYQMWTSTEKFKEEIAVLLEQARVHEIAGVRTTKIER